MFQLEYVNPSLRTEILRQPIRFLPNPLDMSGGLEGIKLGKFFSRVFHPKGIVKKVPRMLAGAATGALMGGGWSGAAAGALTAAAFKRKAGTSLFQDVFRGGMYGMIGGTAVGVGKVALGRSSEAGLVGKGYDYVKKTFFGPKPTIQYEKPIGPELPRQGGGSENLPVSNSGSKWGEVWNVTKEVLPGTMGLGGKVVDYMTAEQQAKAAQYTAAGTQVSSGEIGGQGPGSVMPWLPPNITNPGGEWPGGPVYGRPGGVPGDITVGGPSYGGGGPMIGGPSVMPGEMPGEMIAEEGGINWKPILLIGGLLVGGFVVGRSL